MKIYIQHNDNEPLFPIGFDEITCYITPDDWCEVDRFSYELEMDKEHNVRLSFAPIVVDYQAVEEDLKRAFKCALDDIYGGKPLPETRNNK